VIRIRNGAGKPGAGFKTRASAWSASLSVPPNANAFAERFVRSVKEECVDRMIPFGEAHFRRAVTEFVKHYHDEPITRASTIVSLPDRQSSTERVAYAGTVGFSVSTSAPLEDRRR